MILNPLPWPNDARCAVAITLDMDADSILHLAHPQDSYRKVASYSSLSYGPLVAMPRILATYREYGIQQTFFIPAWCIEQYPQAVEPLLEQGHELAHHGYLHEHPNELSLDEERYWLHRGIETIKKISGKAPRGWRAPLYNFSEHSADLLIEAGFKYDASLMGDDIPYVLQGSAGRLVEIPSHWGLDDWPQFMHSQELGFQMPIQSPQAAMAVYWAEFEAAWQYGGLWVPVWHPFLSGRLARWHAISQLIERILKQGSVWFATMEQIAEHVQVCIQQGDYQPRVDQLPYFTEPVLIKGA